MPIEVTLLHIPTPKQPLWYHLTGSSSFVHAPVYTPLHIQFSGMIQDRLVRGSFYYNGCTVFRLSWLRRVCRILRQDTRLRIGYSDAGEYCVTRIWIGVDTLYVSPVPEESCNSSCAPSVVVVRLFSSPCLHTFCKTPSPTCPPIPQSPNKNV